MTSQSHSSLGASAARRSRSGRSGMPACKNQDCWVRWMDGDGAYEHHRTKTMH